MTAVPFGSEHSRFGITVKGERVDVGFYGRATQLVATSVPETVALLRRWRELAISARGHALIIFPIR
ncbi:hypothetical protein D3C87_2012670 [compost metagenome]